MEHDCPLPVIRFLRSSHWNNVRWHGTTFRWHPDSAAPPIMGLVLDNRDAATALFRTWKDLSGNQDSFEELRVTIIEGELSGVVPGYFVHLCPDPDNTMAHATADDMIIELQQFGQYYRTNKMDYLPGSPPMLVRFREEYNKHGEFMLAPVIKREDGQFYVDAELGIIKREIYFMNTQEVAAKLKAKGFDLELILKLRRQQAGRPPPFA